MSTEPIPSNPRRYRLDLAHRIAWTLTYGPIPPGLNVAHSCDNKICVRPDHLFVGAQRVNIYDAMRKGRLSKGERHSRAKLTTEQAMQVLKLRGTLSQKKLAKLFGVSPSAIQHIHARKNWRHISMCSVEEMAE